MMDYRENLQKCHEYVKALEEERRKIEMFPRELPLCLELVAQAIETCKQQLSGGTTTTTTTTDCLNGQSECSEQTTSDGPAFEEFIPIKRNSSSAQAREEYDDELESHNDKGSSGKKSDWLRSVQLWNQSPDPPTTITTKEEHQSNQPRKVSVVEVKKNGGAFHPFKKEKTSGDVISTNIKDSTTATVALAPAPAPATSVCSTAGRADGAGCGTSKKDETGNDGGQGQPRKARRCWSPDLHRRFLNALQQLGGPHVATPKQIRELMKVDGLTNDEVKSHLQKYRLHTRRPAPTIHSNPSTQAPQFVVVGGIWVPPPEYAAGTSLGEAMTTVTAAPPTGIYAPVAAPAPAVLPHHQKEHHNQSSQSGRHSGGTGGGTRCNSPATSSSTHTTTASPAY